MQAEVAFERYIRGFARANRTVFAFRGIPTVPVEISNRPEKEVIRSNRSRGKEISTRTIDSNDLESTRLTASHVRTPARPAKLHNSGKREKGGETPRSVLIPLHPRHGSLPSVCARFFFPYRLFHDYRRNPAKGTG